MLNPSPQQLIALANLNLAHKEYAEMVEVMATGEIGVVTRRNDGEQAIYMHAGGNVWEHRLVSTDETHEIHYIDRDAPGA